MATACSTMGTLCKESLQEEKSGMSVYVLSIPEQGCWVQSDSRDECMPSLSERSAELNLGKASGSGGGRPSTKVQAANSAQTTRSLDEYLLDGSNAAKFTCTETPATTHSLHTKFGQKVVTCDEECPSGGTQTVLSSLDGEESKLESLRQSLSPSKQPSKRGCHRRLSMTSDPPASSGFQECATNRIGNAYEEFSSESQNQVPLASPSTKKTPKRKRSAFKFPLDSEAKASLIEKYTTEVSSLLQYYHEDEKLQLSLENGRTHGSANGSSIRAEVAVLLEESGLPFSVLVGQIFEILRTKRDKNGGSDLTLSSVRSTVLSVAERINFGIARADADVLEDTSNLCLWCWEVRDLKWLPEAQRYTIALRRRRRRKIAERLNALSGMIEALRQEHQVGVQQLMLCKAEEALAKTDDEPAIRAAVAVWLQKNDVKQIAREAKMKEKETLKEQHRLDRENEKESRRLEREEEKKRLQQEREKERQEKEASKERARSSKEALRYEKELKRQQEETEKELKRREREASELKRQSALQKQAGIMDRFLQSKKDNLQSCLMSDTVSNDGRDALKGEPEREEIVVNMDQELYGCSDRKLEDFLSSHVVSWKRIHSQIISEKVHRWGFRRIPKVPVFGELRLQRTSGDSFYETTFNETTPPRTGNASIPGTKHSHLEFEEDDKMDIEWDDSRCMTINEFIPQDSRMDGYKDYHLYIKKRKLLQFDKSFRPAYYGTFSKRSTFVRPRNPFKEDPSIDYENDSDEEWEEEDPGESLSDCEKDEDDEKVDMEDEDENSDGFVVPDGYLSENEGVHLEDTKSDEEIEWPAGESSPMEMVLHSQMPNSGHCLQAFEMQQKVLQSVTDQALHTNRAYIISNMVADGSSLKMSRTEFSCLQALRICIVSPGIIIEPPFENDQQENANQVHWKWKRQKKANLQLPDTMLKSMVEVIFSTSQGLSKSVDVLSRKFPSVSRSQLKAKLREIAEFIDNRWQVKKEIMEKLGLSFPSKSVCIPEENPAIHLKPIMKFFSKRCLPPEEMEIDCQPPEDKELSNFTMKDGINDEKTAENIYIEHGVQPSM